MGPWVIFALPRAPIELQGPMRPPQPPRCVSGAITHRDTRIFAQNAVYLRTAATLFDRDINRPLRSLCGETDSHALGKAPELWPLVAYDPADAGDSAAAEVARFAGASQVNCGHFVV